MNDLYDLEKGEDVPQIYDFYEYLCRFTHSSLCVSTMSRIINEDEKKFMKMAIIQNYYLVKMIIYYVLAFIEHDIKVIKGEYIFFASILYLYKTAKFIQKTNIKFDYVKNIMYESINKDFFDKSEGDVLNLKKEIEMVLKMISENEYLEKSFLEFISI